MTTKFIAGVLSTASLLTLTGCPSFDERTNNQGGGNILSAADKVTQQQLASLTPDEIQILADTFSSVQSDVSVSLTDEQAADAVLFMIEHDLNSFDDIQAFVEEAQRNPGSVEIPESFLALMDSLEAQQAHEKASK